MTTPDVDTDHPVRSRRGIRARAAVEIGPGRHGTTRLTAVRSVPPLGVRMAGGDVHLLGTAAGPMGGDDLGLVVTVAPDTAATVRSVAATVVLPGDGRPSRQSFAIEVQARARLHWAPEPVVVATGSDHRVDTAVDLAPDADLVFVDRLVRGRTGEVGGHLASTVRIERGGEVLVHHGLDTHRSAWSGKSVGGTCRALGLVVLVGHPARGVVARVTPDLAVQRLGDDLVVAIALADDALDLDRLLRTVDGLDPRAAA